MQWPGKTETTFINPKLSESWLAQDRKMKMIIFRQQTTISESNSYIDHTSWWSLSLAVLFHNSRMLDQDRTQEALYTNFPEYPAFWNRGAIQRIYFLSTVGQICCTWNGEIYARLFQSKKIIVPCK